ncbi:MAG: CBS domain-containing protein [Nitrospirota bacterium]|nr:CBS domain-containing protein [Nitrospirota bacterium]MDH5587774.1 CBS domain-containing protein [Nitrospirota bacterium]
MIKKKDVSESGGLIFDRLRVADVMEKEVQFGHEQTKGDVLASLMIEGFGGVPIVDSHQRVVGIVTEFDLLALLDTGKKLSDISAGQVMTHETVSVTPDTDIRTLIYVLQTNHVIRVPVIDNKDGKLVGIVARRDILLGYVSAEPE